MHSIIFTLNNNTTLYTGNPSSRLLDVLRDEFHLTGTKCGCKEGECGACSVRINGLLVNSCLVAMGSLEGAEVQTIEGFSKTKTFEIISSAFEEESAVQCGFCIPGMVLACACLLEDHPNPTKKQIREGIAGNLCRCTGYNAFERAILRVSNITANNDSDSTKKMNQSTYTSAPNSLHQVLTNRMFTDAVPYMGGTDIMIFPPTKPFLYLNQVQEMKKIVITEKELRIGAGVTYSELLHHPELPELFYRVCEDLAAPAIRNVGTIGGNICNGSAKADIALICMLLDATLRLDSLESTRDVPIRDFYKGKKQLDIKDNELLVEIIIPNRNYGTYYYKKVGARDALAIARVSFASYIDIEDGVIQHFATAFGAVSDTILRPFVLDHMLIGLSIKEAKTQILKYLLALDLTIQPIGGRVSAEYRKKVCMNLMNDAFALFLN